MITASITTSETVDELQTLTGTGNAYTIVIDAGDATGSTAAEFSSINGKTTVAVNLTNVTALAGSSLSDLGTLATAIGNSEFSNATGLTTIAVTDTTIDATTLATRIDSYDSINGGATQI